MELTPLESDLLGDLAQDDHRLFEVFQFVRHHHGEDETSVRSIGRQLLETWIERGWLSLAPHDSIGRRADSASDIGQLLTFVDGAETLKGDFPGADTGLRLTDQARADVEWLGRAT